MSHYAKVIDNTVVQVIVAEEDVIQSGAFGNPTDWIQTSYNTYGNTHKLGGTPLRANYACIGDTYDSEHDVFYAPQPYPSWSLNTTTWLWESPIPKPIDEFIYEWNEESLSWIPKQGSV